MSWFGTRPLLFFNNLAGLGMNLNLTFTLCCFTIFFMRPSPTLCFAILKISHFSWDTLLFFLFCDIVHGSFLESDFSIFFFFFTFYPFNPLLESANAGTSYYFIFRGRTVIVSLFYTLKLFSASNESNIFYLFYYYSSRVQCQICLVCKIKSIKYICFVISQYFITITFKT